MRITWADGETGDEKSQVALQHTKLDSQTDAVKAKAAWREALEELGQWLARQG